MTTTRVLFICVLQLASCVGYPEMPRTRASASGSIDLDPAGLPVVLALRCCLRDQPGGYAVNVLADRILVGIDAACAAAADTADASATVLMEDRSVDVREDEMTVDEVRLVDGEGELSLAVIHEDDFPATHDPECSSRIEIEFSLLEATAPVSCEWAADVVVEISGG